MLTATQAAHAFRGSREGTAANIPKRSCVVENTLDLHAHQRYRAQNHERRYVRAEQSPKGDNKECYDRPQDCKVVNTLDVMYPASLDERAATSNIASVHKWLLHIPVEPDPLCGGKTSTFKLQWCK